MTAAHRLCPHICTARERRGRDLEDPGSAHTHRNRHRGTAPQSSAPRAASMTENRETAARRSQELPVSHPAPAGQNEPLPHSRINRFAAGQSGGFERRVHRRDAFCGTSNHTSRARNGGTVPQLRDAHVNAPAGSAQECRMCLSRSGFLDCGTLEARSSLPRFHVILLQHGLLSPSIRPHPAASAQSRPPATHKTVNCRPPWLFRADVAPAFPRLSNSTGVARSKNWSQDCS